MNVTDYQELLRPLPETVHLKFYRAIRPPQVYRTTLHMHYYRTVLVSN
jgi:hypothetical protein